MSIGEKTTFWNLIKNTNLSRISIPRIQRDYVQGRNTAQVKYARRRMIDELFDAITNDKSIDLNFVYGKDENGLFVPIDGQQRLTTLLCLHIYAFSKNNDEDGLKILDEKFEYCTRTSTTRFLKALIKHFRNYFTQDVVGVIDYIEDSAWYSTEWDKDPSVNSFKTVLDNIDRKFAHTMALHERLKSECCPITFMALKISDIGKVNDLYIKMNSRGKPLTEFESFKSELFDYLDAKIPQEILFETSDFKKRADDDWLCMLWDMCDEPAKECDNIYMSFLHQIIINRLVPGKYDDNSSDNWVELNENDGFYNFSNYKPYLKDGKALNDIFFTFELCTTLLSKNPLIKHLIKNFTLENQVRLSAITRYAITVPRNEWSVDSFENWMRILNNLINNTPIDKTERYISACNSIWTINDEMVKASDLYLAKATNDELSAISFFETRQKSEEAMKCKLIVKDNAWKKLIVTAEQHPYFMGEIRFAFILSGIEDYSSICDHKIAQTEFENTLNIIQLLFPVDAASELCVDSNMFRRALLTYGNYSIWANSSYTFFFEGGKGYFNWRRLLRETSSLNIFKKLFADLVSNDVKSADEIKNVLESAIKNYTDTSDEFIYYLIKIPDVMEFMKEKRFRTGNEDAHPEKQRHIFYGGNNLSVRYAEAYSFFVFCKIRAITQNTEYHYGKSYLETDTSESYIEKINDKPCYIAYNSIDKCFCDNNNRAYTDENGQPISNVDNMVLWVESNII